jgi:hypothetical protein
MKFKCKASGNIYDFSESDTEQMLKHLDYEAVVEDEVTEKPSKRSYTKKETASEETDLAA